ncbi:MAG: ABC transporter ATP-binding protein [Anaerolineales bacterium]
MSNLQATPTAESPTKNERNSLLSVQELRVWFELRRFGFGHAGYVRAVDGVSFDLAEGETIAIVGESGCGKSSLMRAILGLHKPTSGKISFMGEDINSFDAQRKRWYHSRVGYVQQDPFGALPPFMPVYRILEEPLIVSGVKSKAERDERIRKSMEEVKLSPVEDFLAKYPHMLSGGQQQRVVIARAMITEPKFLVADEPVSMLDASVRVEILKLLRNLQEKHNLSVIYITHDLSTVSYFSERIFVMYAGQLVEKAPVRKLIDQPAHPYTQALLTGTSEPDARNALTYKEIPPGEPPSLVNPPAGCRFHPRCMRIIKGECDVNEPVEFTIGQRHTVFCWLHK